MKYEIYCPDRKCPQRHIGTINGIDAKIRSVYIDRANIHIIGEKDCYTMNYTEGVEGLNHHLLYDSDRHIDCIALHEDYKIFSEDIFIVRTKYDSDIYVELDKILYSEDEHKLNKYNINVCHGILDDRRYEGMTLEEVVKESQKMVNICLDFFVLYDGKFWIVNTSDMRRVETDYPLFYARALIDSIGFDQLENELC
ncbi:hypothetical protein GQ42DRAFT_18704 [Ramicandelaber brevisporus]|nr:hypothetical protein GQ42DRAFT_18704 [Ramicandelaber brevisporus]